MNIPKAKRFARGDRLYVQAQQIWIILIAVAMSERKGHRLKTITYGELAAKMGYEDSRAGYTLSRQLGIVGTYCKLNDLPPLNTIVVNQETGVPGEGVVHRDGYTVSREQAAVLGEDWFRIRVPTPGTFRKVWENGL